MSTAARLSLPKAFAEMTDSFHEALERAVTSALEQQADAAPSVSAALAALAVHLLEHKVTEPPPRATSEKLVALGRKWLGNERPPAAAITVTTEPDSATLIAEADVEEQRAAGVVRFTFVSATYLLTSEATTLPSYQELLSIEGALVERTIVAADAHRGAYTGLAVSHRWETPEAPDTEGEQTKAIREHLRAHPEITDVWYDYW